MIGASLFSLGSWNERWYINFKSDHGDFPGSAEDKNLGTRVPWLVWEDSTSCGATKPLCLNYWAHAPEPSSRNHWALKPQLEALPPTACAQQQEKPSQ